MDLYNKFINLFFSKPKYYKIKTGPAKDLYLYLALRSGLKKYLGIYENKQAGIMARSVSKGDHCFDLGSHVGYFTIILAKLVGDKGKVFSFEPVKEGFEFQKKSVEKNHFNHVQLFNFALGDMATMQKAYIFSDSGMAHFDRSILGLSEDHESDLLEVCRLDSIPQVRDIERLDFMKVDVEGFEHNALKGGLETVKKHRPDMLIEVHNRENYENIHKMLTKLDYKFYDINMNEVDLGTKFKKQVFHIYVTTK